MAGRPVGRLAAGGPTLEARKLTRIYGGRTVVSAVDLTVKSGEVVGLIGPNGGGKSTVLAMLAGLVRPSSGTATFDGTPTHALATQAAGTIGLVTAEPGLYPALTGRENLSWFAKLYKKPVSADEIGHWTHELGLSDVLDQPTRTLSSGQRQKLSLVRALLLAPRVLLFDEPTANLDPLTAHAIHTAIREQADTGVAIVLCTHDLHAVDAICERAVVLNQTVRHRVVNATPSAPTPTRLHTLFEDAT